MTEVFNGSNQEAIQALYRKLINAIWNAVDNRLFALCKAWNLLQMWVSLDDFLAWSISLVNLHRWNPVPERAFEHQEPLEMGHTPRASFQKSEKSFELKWSTSSLWMITRDYCFSWCICLWIGNSLMTTTNWWKVITSCLHFKSTHRDRAKICPDWKRSLSYNMGMWEVSRLPC